jgi:DNA-binding transcriptional ArsR family regulator
MQPRSALYRLDKISEKSARSKSATSQHLRVLRDGGIVSARRRDRVVMYSLMPAPIVEAAVQMLDTATSLGVE